MLKFTAVNADHSTMWQSPLVALSPPRAPARTKQVWLLIFATALAVFVVLRWRTNRLLP
jgi:hypothetical protein